MFNCLKVTKLIRNDRLLLIANSPAIPGTHFIDLGRMKGRLENLSIRPKWCSGILMSGTIYPSAIPSILIAVILFPACKPCVIIIFPWQYRSSRSQNFFKIGVLKNFALFARKHLCWSLFLIKLQFFKHATLLKRGSNTGVFPWILRNL